MYVFLKGAVEKTGFVHLECVTDSGPVVRVSLSTSYSKISAGATQLKVPLPSISRWSVVALDMETLFATHTTQLFRYLKAVMVCSVMSIRTVLSSALIYTHETLPYEVAFPVDKSVAPVGATSAAWVDLYNFYWLGTDEPGMDDPAPRAPRMLLTESRKKRYNEYASSVPTTDRTRINSTTTARRWGASALHTTTHISPEVPILFTRAKHVLFASGKVIVSMSTETRAQSFLNGHTSAIKGMCADYNRRVLATYQNAPPEVCLWEMRAGGAHVPHLEGVLNVADIISEVAAFCVSDNGATLFLCGRPARTAEHVVVAPQHSQGSVAPFDRSLSLSPGGASGGGGGGSGSPFVHHPHAASAACKNKKNTLCYVLIDISNPKAPKIVLKQLFDVAVSQCVFSPGETDKVVTCDGSSSLRYVRVKGAKFRTCCISTAKVAVGSTQGFHFTSVAFEPTHVSIPTNTLLYTGTTEGYVVVFDYQSVEMLPILQVLCHKGPIRAVIPCGGLCATSGEDGSLRVWPLDFSEYHIEATLGFPLVQADVSRDGLLMAMVTTDCCLSFLKLQDRELVPLLHSHSQRVSALQHHPARATFATVSPDNHLRVFDSRRFCILKKGLREAEDTTLAAEFSALDVVMGGGVGDSMLSGASRASARRQKGVAPMSILSQSHQSAPLMTPIDSSGLGIAVALPKAKQKEVVFAPQPLCIDWNSKSSGEIAIGFTHGLIRVYDIDHSCLLLSFQSHDSDVGSVKYSKNEKWLVSLDRFQLCFSDVRHGYHTSRVSRFMHPITMIGSLCESLDGKHFAVIGCDSTTVQLYEAVRGFEVGGVRDFSEDSVTSAGSVSSIAFFEFEDTIESAVLEPEVLQSSPHLFTFLLVGTTEGMLTVYKIPLTLPDPPLPEELDFGASAPRIPIVKMLSSTCGGGITALSVKHADGAGRVYFAAALQNFESLGVVEGGAPSDGVFCVGKIEREFGVPSIEAKYFFDHLHPVVGCNWVAHSDDVSPVEDPDVLITYDSGGAVYEHRFDGFSRISFESSRSPERASPQRKAKVVQTQSFLPQNDSTHSASEEVTTLRLLPSPCCLFPVERLAKCGVQETSKYAVDVRAEGMSPVMSFSQNSSTSNSVAVTKEGCLVTCMGGVVTVNEALSFADWQETGAAPTSRLLMNDGFVSYLSVSPCKSVLCSAIVYNVAKVKTRLVFWDLQSYSCMNSVSLGSGTPVVQDIAWGVKTKRHKRKSPKHSHSPDTTGVSAADSNLSESPRHRGAHSTEHYVCESSGYLCVLGAHEVSIYTYSYTCEVVGETAGVGVSPDVHYAVKLQTTNLFKEVLPHEEMLKCCEVRGFHGAYFSVASTKGISSYFTGKANAIQRNMTECLGLQCISSAHKESSVPQHLVWTGGRDGSLNAFLVGTAHAPTLVYSSLLFEHNNPQDAPLFSEAAISAVSSDRDLLFVCLHTEGGDSPATPLMKVARVVLSERFNAKGALNQNISVEVVSQINNASGDVGNVVSRCAPIVVRSSIDNAGNMALQRQRIVEEEVINVIVATENGNVLSIQCCDNSEASTVPRSGSVKSPLVSPQRIRSPKLSPLGDPSGETQPMEFECSVDFVRQNLVFPRGASVNFVRSGFRGTLMAIASTDKIGVFDTASSVFIASGLPTAEINDFIFDENLGIFSAEADGCLAVLSYEASTRSIVEKHRYQLSQFPLQSVAFLHEGDDIRKVVVSDKNGGIFALAPQNCAECTVITEPLATRDHVSTKVCPAAMNCTVFLHVSSGFATFSVLEEEGEEGDFDVVCSHSPEAGFFDAGLSSGGEHVVFLQARALVVYDWGKRTVLRTAQLHAAFTHFTLTPDMVFAVLWQEDSPRITLCDYDYHLVQDIDGHVSGIQHVALSRDGRSLLSLSGAASDYECLKWDIRQLQAQG